MIELQDIFRQYIASYQSTHHLNAVQIKAINAIISCRTSALGAHIDRCDECGFEQISYNSCRNRHCPKCQMLAKEDWIDRQKQNLLDCKYFHIVFTIPADLRPLFFQQQQPIYKLLFKAASETLLELCADKKYLYAKPGITAILHTWGQNLSYHPHLHCIVTGGGLSERDFWINGRKKFFLPIKVLSRKFRGKLLYYLRQQQDLQFFGSLEQLNDAEYYDAFLKKLYNIDWVIYCKPPFGNAQKVIDYLGRYTHRVAISNNRIISVKDGLVSFWWRDYSDNNKQKIMTLPVEEFIRRFLMHILPLGFRKIRHYGLFASKDKGKRLILCKRLTGTQIIERESIYERLVRILGIDFNLCPNCHVGRLSRASPPVNN